MPEYRYYKIHDDGKKTTMFNTTKCEVCGKTVIDVNAVGGVVDDIPTYKRLGMKVWTEPWYLDELGYCDSLDKAVCPDCFVEDVRENKARSITFDVKMRTTVQVDLSGQNNPNVILVLNHTQLRTITDAMKEKCANGAICVDHEDLRDQLNNVLAIVANATV